MDDRLICGLCGEVGKVVQDGDAFFVTARCGWPSLEGGMCQTHDCPDQERALRAWEVLRDDDEPQEQQR